MVLGSHLALEGLKRIHVKALLPFWDIHPANPGMPVLVPGALRSQFRGKGIPLITWKVLRFTPYK